MIVIFKFMSRKDDTIQLTFVVTNLSYLCFQPNKNLTLIFLTTL